MVTLKLLRAYLDLTRLHFFFVWPLLFCSGLFLSFSRYGGFSWLLVAKASLIGFLGFEAGFVLNDYIDKEVDKSDIEYDKLTKYWRPFGTRPLSSGVISPNQAILFFVVLVLITSALIFTLPYPQSIYVFSIMVYSYIMESFYQIQKRSQKQPWAQLLGRTDFALFPVAGYLINGHPDIATLLYFLFFYPFAQVHLGMNDIIDVVNDKARGMKTIPLLYGKKGTRTLIFLFTLLHFAGSVLFLPLGGLIMSVGITIGFLFVLGANLILFRGQSTVTWLKALPLIHGAMVIYILSIILDYFI